MSFEIDNPDICARVHYEDLTANPEATLTKLMVSLGEKFAEEMLRHHEGKSNFGTEDPIARGTRGFKPSHGNWTAWDAKKIEIAKALLGDIAVELGYSNAPEHATAGGRA